VSVPEEDKLVRYSCPLHAVREFFGLLTAAVLFATQSAGAADLPKLNIDPRQISVSGLSSGGYMAVQFEVAYSTLVMGAGVIAGGPYYCAQGSLAIASPNCVCVPTIACALSATTRDVPHLIEVTDQNARSGAIDPTSDLRGHRVWMFSGKFDSTVRQEVMDDLRSYYLNYVDSGNIAYKNDLAAEHAMPTNFFGPADCMHIGDPYINNCHFDAAGALLAWIYGPLAGRSEPRGSPSAFSQENFLADPTRHGLAQEGWIYVPDDCRNGSQCRLHVVFHGCDQYPSHEYFDLSQGKTVRFGMTFVKNSGFNQWADGNRIVVLYPQAEAVAGANPNGCWDWWGFDDPDYAQKTGRQIAAVKAMIDAITGAGPNAR
jgi:poly(3-hydroxybutyrate) depolymerase